MRDAVLAGKKVLLCGNGGSAADAQHIAAELVGRFVARAPPARRRSRSPPTPRRSPRSPTTTATSTCSRARSRRSAPTGDVLIAITTSGTSKNVLAAVAAARGARHEGDRADRRARARRSSRRAMPASRCRRRRPRGSRSATSRSATCCARRSTRRSRPRSQPRRPTPIGHRAQADGARAADRVARGAARAQARRSCGPTACSTCSTSATSRRCAAPGSSATSSSSASTATPRCAPTRARSGRSIRCAERVELLAALELVDAILVFDDPTPERVLAAAPARRPRQGRRLRATASRSPSARSSRPTAAASSSSRWSPGARRPTPSRACGHDVARRALFLDRDGTLIVDVGYPRDPAQVEPLPGAIDALRELAAPTSRSSSSRTSPASAAA